MILKLHGHIGSHASALVDGQLSADDEERAWQHVLSCPGCRRLVEKEGWAKQQVASLGRPSTVDAPKELIGTLYDVRGWPAAEGAEKHSARRRTLGMLAGAGSAGLAVMALITVASPPVGRGELVPNTIPATVQPNGNSIDLAALFRSGSGSGSELAPASLRRATR